jgi:hypothetical protein
MRSVFTVLLAAAALCLGTLASAQAVSLTPANPQPGGVKKGLYVIYGESPTKFRQLSHARQIVGSMGKPGRPLRGLDYWDTIEGEPVMTSKQTYHVAADIKGYIRFNAPGTYDLEFFVNDGIEARISGQSVAYYDGIQGCDSTGVTTVQVPKAGWYDLDILYFQKAGTSCLMMKWAKQGGKLDWVPNSAFGY